MTGPPPDASTASVPPGPGMLWAPSVPAETAAAVRAAVDALAGRPRPVPRAVPHDLGAGGAGLALAFDQLDRCRPGQGWRVPAVGYLDAAVRGSARTGPPGHGLFSGLAGLAFAATALQRPWPAGCLTAAAEHARLRADPSDRRTVDLISGLTGTGACLLSHAGDPPRAGMLHTVLTALSGLPPLPHHGMAHGTAGPLALLSLASRAGIEVPDQRETVHRLAAALAAARTYDVWGDNWPAPPGHPGHARASWCQGGPGISRALWLAGTALDDGVLRELACGSLKAALRRPAPERGVDTVAGLCHGLAGLLQITLRFARDTGDPAFHAAADTLAGRLLALCDPPPRRPGFLGGAAGVVLALLAATTRQAPLWDRALLLA